MQELREKAEKLADKFICEEKDYLLGAIDAEQSNPKTRTFSQSMQKDAVTGVRMLLSVDEDLLPIYEHALHSHEFDELCEKIFDVLTCGGRVILSGCGSSGRLCMNIEKAFRRACAKHGFSEYESRVITVMTGGDYALIRSVENLEDYESLSRKQIEELNVCEKDMLIGVTATGETTSIVGTAIEASERGASVCMVICSDLQKMLGKIDRIDRLYKRANVRVLYLKCGAFAIAGSSRMQSSTIEQAVISSAFEAFFAQLLGRDFDKEKLCADYAQMLAYLTSDSVLGMLADYAVKETELYKKNAYVTYFSEDYVLDLVTDTTERGPTFSTPPFKNKRMKDQPLSWSFVKNPSMTARDAWIDCLGREPRCLTWDDSVYRSVGIEKKMPDISKDRLFDFEIGNESDREREGADGIAVWIDAKAPTDAFFACASVYREQYVLVFEFGGRETEMDIFEHLSMKMAMNVISTASMALFGRIHGNYMTYLNISNKKLIDRGARIIADLCAVSYREALVEQYYFSLVHQGKVGISATQEAIRYLRAMKNIDQLKKNAEEYSALLAFPSEAQNRLRECLDTIAKNEETFDGFCRLLSEYDESCDLYYSGRAEKMKVISELAGIDAREGWLILYVCMLPRLRRYFEEKGIADQLFLDIIPDLRYKLQECLAVEGIYGLMESAVGAWYALLFRCRLLCFGRLQFVFQDAKFTCECDGVQIEEDTPVLNIHIPKTGGKLDREGVQRAYREAAAYYAPLFGDRPIIMTCVSWMLFPRHEEFLSPDSNMMQFYRDFTLVSSGVYENYASVWRVFDRHYTGDVDDLPKDTSLRRAYAELIRKGEKTGWGRGVRIVR